MDTAFYLAAFYVMQDCMIDKMDRGMGEGVGGMEGVCVCLQP